VNPNTHQTRRPCLKPHGNYGCLKSWCLKSTVRGSVLFATDPIHAAGVVSASAVALAEGVRKTMIRVRLHATFLAALAVTGLLAPAWLAVAHQAPDDRAEIKAPPAGKAAGPSAVDIGGNWIVRGGERFAVIRIEGPPGQRRARSRRSAPSSR
jgi:hypothetical protein